MSDRLEIERLITDCSILNKGQKGISGPGDSHSSTLSHAAGAHCYPDPSKCNDNNLQTLKSHAERITACYAISYKIVVFRKIKDERNNRCPIV